MSVRDAGKEERKGDGGGTEWYGSKDSSQRLSQNRYNRDGVDFPGVRQTKQRAEMLLTIISRRQISREK